MQVSAVTDSGTPASESDARLRLVFAGGRRIDVAAGQDPELQLAEDAAHRMHSVHEGSGEIHQRAAQSWEQLRRTHGRDD